MEKLLIKDRAGEFKHAPDTIRAYFENECPMTSPIQWEKWWFRWIEIQTIHNPWLWETYWKISVWYYQDNENPSNRHWRDTHKTEYYKGINEAMQAIRERFTWYDIEIDEDLQKKFDYFNIKALPYNEATELLLKLCGEFWRRERKALETLQAINPDHNVPEWYTCFDIIGTEADFQITRKTDWSVSITN
jgi:hypothetical protein